MLQCQREQYLHLPSESSNYEKPNYEQNRTKEKQRFRFSRGESLLYFSVLMKFGVSWPIRMLLMSIRLILSYLLKTNKKVFLRTKHCDSTSMLGTILYGYPEFGWNLNRWSFLPKVTLRCLNDFIGNFVSESVILCHNQIPQKRKSNLQLMKHRTHFNYLTPSVVAARVVCEASFYYRFFILNI